MAYIYAALLGIVLFLLPITWRRRYTKGYDAALRDARRELQNTISRVAHLNKGGR